MANFKRIEKEGGIMKDILVAFAFFIFYAGIVLLLVAFVISKANITVIRRFAQQRGRKLSDIYAPDGNARRPTGLLSQCGTNVKLSVKINTSGKKVLKVIGSESVSTVNADLMLLK
jgi:hypothetical protein